MRLVDKVAIVTGCARKGGLGYAIAMRLAAEGAHIVAADYCRPSLAQFSEVKFGQWEQLQQLSEEVRTLGRRSIAVTVDVTRPDEVKAMAEAAMAEFGRVDILCNNAGGWVGDAPFLEMTLDAFTHTLAMNVTGTFLCSQYVAPRMIEGNRGGRIINTASVAAKRAGPGVPCSYIAAKHAVLGLTKAMARELAPHKITVNAVCPGFVPTERFEDLRIAKLQRQRNISRDEAVKTFESAVPLGRMASGQDVANAVAFLACDESDYITGEGLDITGGR